MAAVTALGRDHCHTGTKARHGNIAAPVFGRAGCNWERLPLKLDEYHGSAREQERVADLMSLLPRELGAVLDIGARDGYISRRLADHAQSVTALDLELPAIDDPRITCVKGDATALEFDSGSFDLVFCAEVLEHIPGSSLEKACAEIARVSRHHVLIGVPYRQDLRLWRTTCQQCEGINPPWAHVNSFDEARLRGLFPGLTLVRQNFVGTAEPGTNAVSAWLMDRAGNPYGTYVQEEGCVHCGAKLVPRPSKTPTQSALTKLALGIRKAANLPRKSHGNWVHLLLGK